MQRKYVIVSNFILLAWFFLDMTGLYFKESYLVTRAWREDGIFFLVFIFSILLFMFKEQIGKYILSIWLIIWLLAQFLSHEWITIVGGGEGKIRYFKDSIKLINSDTLYIPDLYHIILHVLILVALAATLSYSIKFNK